MNRSVLGAIVCAFLCGIEIWGTVYAFNHQEWFWAIVMPIAAVVYLLAFISCVYDATESKE